MFISFCCDAPTVRRPHECTLLTSRLPGSPGSSLLGGCELHHKTEAEPNDPSDGIEEPPAEAEPAPAGQLQDHPAAAAPLHVWSPAVIWPHIQHSAHPHRGFPVRTLDDVGWRQTENALAQPPGFPHVWKNTRQFIFF